MFVPVRHAESSAQLPFRLADWLRDQAKDLLTGHGNGSRPTRARSLRANKEGHFDLMAVITSSTMRGAVGRRRRFELTGVVHPGLPFYVVVLLPVFWALGVGFFTFAIAALPMGLGLLLIKPIRVPRGFGLWLLFVGWMLISALMLEPTVNRYLSFLVRASVYIAATIIFLYVYNMPQKYLPTGRILNVLGGIFVFAAIVGGYLGLILGEVRFNTPFSQILPRSMLQNSFVNSVVRPPFAQRHDFLGFPINRPAMPFSSTNDWAATLAPGTFAAIAAAARAQRFRRFMPVLALLALVPMAVSANRALWITLILAVFYVAARRASSGQLVLAIRLVIVFVFAGALILVSPLGEIVGARATSSHSIEARGDIYTDVLEAVPGSPILGYGAPLANPNPNRPAIGTHGMLWTSLFSQGIPGAIFYVGFWIGMTLRTGRNVRNQEHLLLHLAVASSLPTLLFYDHIPAALPMLMICAAVILRDSRESDARSAAAVSRHTNR